MYHSRKIFNEYMRFQFDTILYLHVWIISRILKLISYLKIDEQLSYICLIVSGFIYIFLYRVNVILVSIQLKNLFCNLFIFIM